MLEKNLEPTIIAPARNPASMSELDKEFLDAGFDVSGEMKTKEVEELTTQYGPALDQAIANKNQPTFNAGKEAVKVIAGGAVDFAEKVVNGLATIGEFVSNTAKVYSDAPDVEIPRVEMSQFVPAPETEAGQISRQIVSTVAPLAIPGGQSMTANVVIGGVVDFLGQDPSAPRLSDIEQFKNIAPAFLATKPGDTELESRLKNAAEGMLLNTVAGGALKAGAKIWAKKTAETVMAATDVEKIGRSAKAGTLTDTNLKGAIDEALPAQARINEGLTKVDEALDVNPVQSVLKNNAADDIYKVEARAAVEGVDPTQVAAAVRVNAAKIDSPERLQFIVDEIIETNPEFVTKIKGLRTDDELLEDAARVAANPQQVEELMAQGLDRASALAKLDEKVIVINQLANSAADDVFETALKLGDDASLEDLVGLVDKIDGSLLVEKVAARAGVAAGVGRGLRAFQVAELGTGRSRAEMVNQIAQSFGGSKKLEDLRTMVKQIKDIDKTLANKSLKDVASLSSSMKVGQAVSSVTTSSMLSFRSLFTATVGSSVNASITAAKNYVSAGIGGAKNFSAARLGFGKGSPDAVTFRQANDYAEAHIKFFQEAMANAGASLRLGKSVNPGAVSKLDLEQFSFRKLSEDFNINADKNFAYKGLAKALDTFGYVATTPARFIAPADSFFGTLAYRAKQHMDIKEEIAQLGLVGERAQKYYDTKIGQESHLAKANAERVTLSGQLKTNPAIARDISIRRQAKDALADSRKVYKEVNGTDMPMSAQREYIANFEKNLTTDNKKKAAEYVQEMARGSATTNFLQSGVEFLDRAPIMKTILPFMRTSLNEIKFSLDHSMFAPVSSRTRAAIMAGGRESDDALAEISIGMTGMGIATYMAANKMLTGEVPINPQVEQALRESNAGWRELSLKVGDNYYDLKSFGPLRQYARVGSFFAEARNYLNDQEYLDLVSAGSIAMIDQFNVEGVTGTISDLSSAVKEITSSVDKKATAGTKVIEGILARAVPLGAVLNQVGQVTDGEVKSKLPTDLDDNGPVDQFLEKAKVILSSRLPYYNSEIKPQRNVFGEVVHHDSGWLEPDETNPGEFMSLLAPGAKSTQDNSEVVQKLRALTGWAEELGLADPTMPELSISMPEKILKNSIDDEPFRLTADEYDAFSQAAAGINPETGKPFEINGRPIPTLREVVTSLIPDPQELQRLRKEPMGHAKVKEVIAEFKNAFIDYRAEGREYVKNLPSVKKRMLKEMEFRNNLKAREK